MTDPCVVFMEVTITGKYLCVSSSLARCYELLFKEIPTGVLEAQSNACIGFDGGTDVMKIDVVA